MILHQLHVDTKRTLKFQKALLPLALRAPPYPAHHRDRRGGGGREEMGKGKWQEEMPTVSSVYCGCYRERERERERDGKMERLNSKIDIHARIHASSPVVV